MFTLFGRVKLAAEEGKSVDSVTILPCNWKLFANICHS